MVSWAVFLPAVVLTVLSCSWPVSAMDVTHHAPVSFGPPQAVSVQLAAMARNMSFVQRALYRRADHQLRQDTVAGETSTVGFPPCPYNHSTPHMFPYPVEAIYATNGTQQLPAPNVLRYKCVECIPGSWAGYWSGVLPTADDTTEGSSANYNPGLVGVFQPVVIVGPRKDFSTIGDGGINTVGSAYFYDEKGFWPHRKRVRLRYVHQCPAHQGFICSDTGHCIDASATKVAGAALVSTNATRSLTEVLGKLRVADYTVPSPLLVNVSESGSNSDALPFVGQTDSHRQFWTAFGADVRQAPPVVVLLAAVVALLLAPVSVKYFLIPV